MRITRCLTLAMLLPALAAYGCDVGKTTSVWTIFVYGHADNSLSPSLVTDMAKMAKADLGADVRVVVAADWNAGTLNSSTDANFPTGTEWFLVEGSGKVRELGTISEQNLDDPVSLSEAIARAFGDFPAQRYGIILWNHGGAWDRGFGGDEQDGTVAKPAGMSLPDIRTGLSEGLKRVGMSEDRPLEFLVFDTCLLGSAETSQALKDFAKVFIANAEFDFGAGLNYKDALTQLAANPFMSAVEFGKMEAVTWESLHKTKGFSDKLLRSHVVLDTVKLDALAAAAKDFTASVRVARDSATQRLTHGEALARRAFFSLPSYGKVAYGRDFSPDYRDFGEFLASVASQKSFGEIATKASTVKKVLDVAVIGSASGDLRMDQSQFHIALPDISIVDEDYIKSYKVKAAAWSDATQWGDLLSDLMAANPKTGPEVSRSIQNAANPTAQNPPTITFSSATSSAALVTLELVTSDPGTPGRKMTYGSIVQGAVQSGGGYKLIWTGKVWTIGTLKQPVAVVPWVTNEKDLNDPEKMPTLSGAYGTITVQKAGGKADMEAVFMFGGDQDAVDTVSYRDSPNALWAAVSILDFLKEYPGATFIPAVLRWDPAKGENPLIVKGTPEPLPASGLIPMEVASAPAGSYTLVTTCYDVWGNSTTVTDDVTVVAPF